MKCKQQKANLNRGTITRPADKAVNKEPAVNKLISVAGCMKDGDHHNGGFSGRARVLKVAESVMAAWHSGRPTPLFRYPCYQSPCQKEICFTFERTGMLEIAASACGSWSVLPIAFQRDSFVLNCAVPYRRAVDIRCLATEQINSG